jgi:TonB family protein
MQSKKRMVGVAILLCLGGAFAQTHTDAEGNEVFKVGGGVSAPAVIEQPAPEYSEQARRERYQGTCVLWLIVGTDGRPHDIRVSRTLGLGLDDKAIEAVKQWKFKPAMKDGKPVAVEVSVEVNFKLYNGPFPNTSLPVPPAQNIVDNGVHFTKEQLAQVSALWSAKPSPEQLADLRAKCAGYIDKSLEDLKSKRVALPPHECAGVLGWMRNLDVESLYVAEKPRQ